MRAISCRRFLLGLLVGLLPWFCAPPPAQADTYQIQPDGSGDFPTIQQAINDPLVVDGDVLELADGTFSGTGNRGLNFIGKSITLCSQSGNPEACIIDCEHGARGIQLLMGEGAETTIEGITIMRGLAYLAPDGAGGAAVLCSGTSPTISNCVFSSNFTDQQGGAICCGNNAGPTIEGCRFSFNLASFGGGAIAYIGECGIDIADCLFEENWGYYFGGAIHYDAGDAQIRDCTFLENRTEKPGAGGGGLSARGSGLTLTGCIFAENQADEGGGLLLEGDPGALVLIDHCTFHHNGGYVGGGAILSRGPSPTLTNTILAFSWRGEGIRADGGTPVLSCCLIYGNDDGPCAGMADPLGSNGNISTDPLFCDPDGGEFTLNGNSPCAAFTPPNETCDLIGAAPVACQTAERVCCVGSTCYVLPEQECLDLGGSWHPEFNQCFPSPCPTPIVMRSWGSIKTLFRN